MPNMQALAQILQARALGQPVPMTGSTSVGPSLPQQPAFQYPIRPVAQGGPAQGEFQTKGAHQRASMASLVNSVQGTVATITNKINEQKNRQMTNLFGTFINAQKGINQAQEMQRNAQAILQQEPNNAQAKQMLETAQNMMQQNSGIMGSLLQDKKNHKLLEKAFGIDDKNADTPERKAAIAAMRKANPSMSPQTAQFMSQIPQTAQVSPLTQLEGQMIQQGILPKAPTGASLLTAAGRERATEEKAREFDVKNLNARDQTSIQAVAHGLKPSPDGKGFVPMTPEDLKQYPLLQQKLDLDKANMALRQAQTALAQARAQGEPMRIAQAQERLRLTAEGVQQRQQELELKLHEATRRDRAEDFKEGQTASGEALPGMKALSTAAQNTVMTTDPILTQVQNLKDTIAPLKGNNTPGYYAADRLMYAMGMKSNIAGETADQIANLELQKVVAAASVMKGSSRTIQALRIAMQHTPDVWKDSPAMIYQKLDTIQNRLQDVINDAYTYGKKGGYVPANPTNPKSKPEILPPAPKQGDPLGLF